ncbi:MAG: T9SS type A sorting domain-containing protein [Bacteroidota bacterium]
MNVDAQGYLLEFCERDDASGIAFATDNSNFIRWYNDDFQLISALNGSTKVSPDQVGVTLSAGGRLVEQATSFYFTSTDGTGCESDFRQVLINVYPIPDEPVVMLGSFPEEADQGLSFIFEYCIPKSGAGVDPDNIMLDPLNQGEEYVVEQTEYYDSLEEIAGKVRSGFLYEFQVTTITGAFNYGDDVELLTDDTTPETAFGYVYSLSNDTLTLNLRLSNYSFANNTTITNRSSTATANGVSFRTQYALPGNSIDVPRLISEANSNSFRYTVSKTENINGSSNFAGCNGDPVFVFVVGWDQPEDVSISDFEMSTLSYHVSEASMLENIEHIASAGMDGYVWYEDQTKNDTIAVLVNGGSMTQNLLDDPKNDPSTQLFTAGGLVQDRNDDGINDVYTYYVTRYDHENEGLNAGFPGCESEMATEVTLTVHAIQPQPTVISDNSSSANGTPDFTDLNLGSMPDNSVDHYFSLCVDQLESDLTFVADEITFTGAREFRWYESDVNGVRGDILPANENGIGTFSDLGLSGLNPTGTISRYFEVIQLTDNDVFEGTESVSTFVRVDVSPQDNLSIRDENTALPFGDIFCRNDGEVLNVALFAGTSPAAESDITHQVDSYFESTFLAADQGTADIVYTITSGTYILGETISGSISGETARIISDDGTTLGVNSMSGAFQVGEVLTGATSLSTSTVNSYTETTPAPEISGSTFSGNPDLDFESLHDAVFGGPQPVGGEPTVHVVTLTYIDPVTTCEASTNKVVTVYADPEITILVNGADVAGFTPGDEQFCYEEVGITLQGALADGTPVTSGAFSSSELGGLTTSNGAAAFSPQNEHNAYHTNQNTIGGAVTGDAGIFLNQSEITVTFTYTDPVSGCDNSVDAVLRVNPEAEFYDIERVAALPTSDLASGRLSNVIRLSNFCNDGTNIDATVELVDPEAGENTLETDYSGYTFDWSIGSVSQQVVGSNAFNFPLSAEEFTVNLTVTDPNGCQSSISETHSLQPLPDLEMTMDGESGAAAFEFCSDDANPALGLSDNNTALVVPGAAIDPANVNSWIIISSNSSGSVTGINNGSGSASLPSSTDLDLQTLHESAGGNVYTDFDGILRSVGGDTTYHEITIEYTDPQLTYQGLNTSCQNTIVETLTIFPNPNVNFSIQLSGEDEASFDDFQEFCYTPGGPGNITLRGLEIFPDDTLSLTEGQVNRFLRDGQPVPTNNGEATINVAELLGNQFAARDTFLIEYQYRNVNGCEHFFRKSIIVNPLPQMKGTIVDNVVDAIVVANSCASSAVEVFVEMEDEDEENYQFTWTVNGGDPQVQMGSAGGNFFSQLLDPGETTLTFGVEVEYVPGASPSATFATSCSAVSLSKQVTVGQEPIPAFSWVGLTVGSPLGTDITVFQDNAALNDLEIDAFFFLIDGDTAFQDSIPGAFPITFNYDFATSGQYQAVLRMTTNAGCDVSRTRIMNVLPHITGINNSNAYLETFETVNLATPQDGWWRENRTLNDAKEDTLFTSWLADGNAPELPQGFGNSVYSNYNTTEEGEISFIYSPSFDLTNLNAPTIRFDRYESFESTRDGAVLQFTVDDGRTWDIVGSYNSMLEAQGEGLGSTPGWYNNDGTSSAPGTQVFTGGDGAPGESLGPGADNTAGYAWAGQSGWEEAIAPLDVSAAFVRFRIALAGQGGTKSTTGFGFDNLEIYSRDQIVLQEVFSSSLDNASVQFLETIRTDAAFSGNDILTINYFTDLKNQARLDPLNARVSSDANAKTAFYGVDDVPSLAISGTPTLIADDNPQLALTKARLNNAKLNTPGFEITVTASEVDDALLIDTDYRTLRAFGPGNEIGLFLAIVEPEIVLSEDVEALPSGTILQNTLRKLLPNGAGKYVRGPLISGRTLDFDTTWAISGLMNGSALRVIAFAQDLNTKDIYQAASVDVSLTLETALSTKDLSTQVEIFPNPSDDQFTIELGEASSNTTTWSLYDQSGRSVLSGEIDRKISSAIVDTRDIPSGLYLIKIDRPNRSLSSSRVIVLHR